MEVRFRRGMQQRTSPTPIAVPPQIVELASSLRTPLGSPADGRISHAAAARLYGAVVGFDEDVIRRASVLESQGRLTFQGLSYIVSTGIWELHEASWILLNALSPEATLFGEPRPENRLAYQDAVSFGRAVVAISRLRQRLSLDETGKDLDDCVTRVNGRLIELVPARDVRINWTADGGDLHLRAGHPLLVLPCSRPLLRTAKASLLEDAEVLADNASDSSIAKFLLLTNEWRTWAELSGHSLILEATYRVTPLFIPYSQRELDDQVEEKMARARVLRK